MWGVDTYTALREVNNRTRRVDTHTALREVNNRTRRDIDFSCNARTPPARGVCYLHHRLSASAFCIFTSAEDAGDGLHSSGAHPPKFH